MGDLAVKMEKKERHILSGVFACTYFSGLFLYIFSHWIRVLTPIGEQHHPSEQWVRVLHTGVTYLVVIAFGYMVKGHVIPGLRLKKKIPSGSGLVMVFVLLTVTALYILYSGESSLTSSVAQIHLVVGLATPVLIILHVIKRRDDWKRRLNDEEVL
jgi:hypothetical protein